MMRPTLVALSDGHARSQSQLRDLLAEAMGVTAEERELLLPSGKQAILKSPSPSSFQTSMSLGKLLRGYKYE